MTETLDILDHQGFPLTIVLILASCALTILAMEYSETSPIERSISIKDVKIWDLSFGKPSLIYTIQAGRAS